MAETFEESLRALRKKKETKATGAPSLEESLRRLKEQKRGGAEEDLTAKIGKGAIDLALGETQARVSTKVGEDITEASVRSPETAEKVLRTLPLLSPITAHVALGREISKKILPPKSKEGKRLTDVDLAGIAALGTLGFEGEKVVESLVGTGVKEDPKLLRAALAGTSPVLGELVLDPINLIPIPGGMLAKRGLQLVGKKFGRELQKGLLKAIGPSLFRKATKTFARPITKAGRDELSQRLAKQLDDDIRIGKEVRLNESLQAATDERAKEIMLREGKADSLVNPVIPEDELSGIAKGKTGRQAFLDADTGVKNLEDDLIRDNGQISTPELPLFNKDKTVLADPDGVIFREANARGILRKNLPVAPLPEEKLTARRVVENIGAFDEKRLMSDTPAMTDKVARIATDWLDRVFGPGAARKVRGIVSPFYDIENRALYEVERYKLFGRLSDADNLMIRLRTMLKPFTTQERTQMFNVLRGEMDEGVLDGAAKLTVDQIRNLNNRLGELLVKEKLIKPEQFAARKGQYIHYMYAEKLMGEEAFTEISRMAKKRGISMTEAAQSYGRERVLNEEQRQALGLIEDIGIVEPYMAGRQFADISKSQFNRAIRQNFSTAGSTMEIDGVNYSLRELDQEIAKFKDKFFASKGDEALAVKADWDRFERSRKQLKGQLDALKKQGDTALIPDREEYGALAGIHVPKPIAGDITQMYDDVLSNSDDIVRAFENVNKEIINLFKISKVPFNPPTVARNCISNIGQLLLSGMNPFDMPGHMVDAFNAFHLDRQIMKGGKKFMDVLDGLPAAEKERLLGLRAKFRLAQKHGNFKTNFAEAELSKISDGVTGVATLDPKTGLLRLKDAQKLSDVIKAAPKMMRDWAGFYGKIDDYYKMVKFSEVFDKSLARGLSRDEAAQEATRLAQKWIMDYSVLHPVLNKLRRNTFLFGTYQWKAAPLVAEAMIERPLTTLALLNIPLVMTAVSAKKLNLTDKEWRGLRRSMPGWITRNQTFAMLPTRNKEGRVQWVNTEYLSPWGSISQLTNSVVDSVRYGNPKEFFGALPKAFGFGHPIYDMVKSFQMGREDDTLRDVFTGKPIYNSFDSPTIKAMKTSRHMAAQLMGSAWHWWNPSSPTWQSANIGKRDRTGAIITAPKVAAKWAGINIYSPSPAAGAKERQFKEREAMIEFSRLIKDPTKSKAQKRRAAKDLKKRLVSLKGGDVTFSESILERLLPNE